MGVKKTHRILAVLIAVVMVMTSGIAVFAAGSNTGGSTAPETYVEVQGKTVIVNNPTDVIKYKMYGKKKYKTASSNVLTGLKKGKRYVIFTGGKVYKVLIAGGKVKKATVKKNKVTVRISRKKGAKKYVIRAVRVSDGKVVKKTVRSLTKKLKLEAGEWQITVTPKNGKYVGQTSAVKTVVVY